MGLFKIGKDVVKPVADAVADVRKTKITGERAQETTDEFEVLSSVEQTDEKKPISLSKLLINAIVGGVAALGGYIVVKIGMGAFRFEMMSAYKDYVLAITPMVGILIGVVGAGRGFKHSKWAKES